MPLCQETKIHDFFFIRNYTQTNEKYLKVFHPVVACLFMFIICQKGEMSNRLKGLKVEGFKSQQPKASFHHSIVIPSSVDTQNAGVFFM